MPINNFQEFTELRNRWERDGYQMMTREMVEDLDRFFADQAMVLQYDSEGFTRAKAGDFCRYETVEPMMKGYLGAKKCFELFDKYQGNIENPDLQKEIKDRLMEADLRAGFALGGKNPGDEISDFLNKCEKIANRQMLIQTLEDPHPEAKLRLLEQLEQEDPAKAQENLQAVLNADLEQRVEIAKMLFMNHLGKFQTYNNNDEQLENNENMAEVYAHGGRTMFILPAGEDQKPVMDGIEGSQKELTGLQSRKFATHGVEPRKLHKDGSIKSEAKELKLKALSTFSFSKHQGMNASVGGLGHVGPNGKVITADGTNGHMYMHLVSGEKNVCGMMLVGFENSGPGEKGRLGSTHDARAKKAGGSAFLSDKSYLGKERGGRVVDLSGLSGRELGSLLKAFENAYRTAAKAAQIGSPDLLDACNRLLTGKTMTVGQLKGMLEGMDVGPEPIKLVEKAREGHPALGDYIKIDPKDNPSIPMTIEENPEKKVIYATKFDDLPRPEKPKFMKKPGFWDKVLYTLSFHSRYSYVSKYNEYQKTIHQRMEHYNREIMEYNSTMNMLKQGRGDKVLQEAYNRAVDNTIARVKEVFKTSVEKPAALKPQAKESSNVVKPASKEVAEQLVNALVDMLFAKALQNKAPENKLEEMKSQYQDHIRETERFKKVIASGEEQVNTLLNDPKKMDILFTDVALQIQNATGHSQPQNQNQIPLIKQDMVVEQPNNEFKSLV